MCLTDGLFVAERHRHETRSGKREGLGPKFVSTYAYVIHKAGLGLLYRSDLFLGMEAH